MVDDHLKTCSLGDSDIAEDKKVLDIIYNSESRHFTLARMTMYVFNFICLLIT